MTPEVTDGSPDDLALVEATWRDEIAHRVDDYLDGNQNLVGVEESHARTRVDLAAARK